MVSLELVGEVFEVRTQVDRDFTTVSRVDHRLGLIENLGRHTIWIFFDFMYSISSSCICLSNFNSTFVFQCRKGVMEFFIPFYLSSNCRKSERSCFFT
jgi:hypothetical protein